MTNGLTMAELMEKSTIGSSLITDGTAFAMRHDKWKVAKLEGEYKIEKINKSYTKGTAYILLRDLQGLPFSLIAKYNKTTGLKIK